MALSGIVMKTFRVGEKRYTLEIFSDEDDRTEVLDSSRTVFLTFTSGCYVHIGTKDAGEQLGRMSMREHEWFFIQDSFDHCVELTVPRHRNIYTEEVEVATAYLTAMAAKGEAP